MLKMYKLVAAVVVLSVLLYALPVLGFGKYYAHKDDKKLWWYINEDPAFEIAIPALQAPTNIRYFTEQTLFGEESIIIHFGQSGPVLTLGYVKGEEKDIPKVQKALLGRYEYLFSNIQTVDSRKLQTDLKVDATFIHQSAKTADGKTAMVRAIFFNKDGAIVYLTYFCYQEDFTGFPREAWFTAVNSFKWR
jgi:hypothetical protein